LLPNSFTSPSFETAGEPQGKTPQDDRAAAAASASKESFSRLHGLYQTAVNVLKQRGVWILNQSQLINLSFMMITLADVATIDMDEDRYCCLSTLDAVSKLEDSTEAWIERRIRAAMALVGRYVAKPNFSAAVQILQKVMAATSFHSC